MTLDVLSGLISRQSSRPVSLAVTVVALFVPASLVIFLEHPELYSEPGVAAVILLGVGISFPIVLLCYSIWHTFISFAIKMERIAAGEPLAEDDFLRATQEDDPLEWPCLMAASWSANAILYLVTLIAYYKAISMGKTFILVAALLAFGFLVVAGLTGVAFARIVRDHHVQEREPDAKVRRKRRRLRIASKQRKPGSVEPRSASELPEKSERA